MAFRSLLRPSSPDDAKAFAKCPNLFAVISLIKSRRLDYPQTDIESVKELKVLAGGGSGARWWAQVDLNHRPRAYQARALTN